MALKKLTSCIFPKKKGINVIRIVVTIPDIIQPFKMCTNKTNKKSDFS